jgi:hypothetical protein
MLLGLLLATPIALAAFGLHAVPASWAIALWVGLFVAAVAAVAVISRKITTHRVFWCPHCGVVTDPRFRICRACGRVKS